MELRPEAQALFNLSLVLKWCNVSLLGLQEQHIPVPPKTKEDVVGGRSNGFCPIDGIWRPTRLFHNTVVW